MPEPLRLPLTPEQRQCLEDLRDHHPQAYQRERASVLLQVADGHSGRWCARYGGLRPHHPTTITRWVQQYLTEGVAGLRVHQGRGRKPAFSPSSSRRGPGEPAGTPPSVPHLPGV